MIQFGAMKTKELLRLVHLRGLLALHASTNFSWQEQQIAISTVGSQFFVSGLVRYCIVELFFLEINWMNRIATWRIVEKIQSKVWFSQGKEAMPKEWRKRELRGFHAREWMKRKRIGVRLKEILKNQVIYTSMCILDQIWLCRWNEQQKTNDVQVLIERMECS